LERMYVNTPVEHRTSGYKKSDRRTPRKGSQQEKDWWHTRKVMAVNTAPKRGVHWVASMVKRSVRTLYRWLKAFRERGPDGLREGSRRPHTIHRLDDDRRKTIVAIRKTTGIGCEKIALELRVSPSTVHKVLGEEGMVFRTGRRTRFRHFERKHANSLWQLDYTFIRDDLWLLQVVDDHSRFIVGHRFMAMPNAGETIALMRSCFSRYGVPEQVLTDHGSQFVPTTSGTSEFTGVCLDLGIRHILASVRHPQTTGKVERRHGLVKDHLDAVGVGRDAPADEIERAVREFVEYHNFSRMHFGYERYVIGDFRVCKKVVFLPFMRFVCHR